MLRVSFVCILVMVVLLSATLSQAATTIIGLESSYSSEENFEGTIASFTVDPPDAVVKFIGPGLINTKRLGSSGTYDGYLRYYFREPS